MERGRKTMSQELEESQYQTLISAPSTKIESENLVTPVILRPPDSVTKVDDKAAALEASIESMRAEFRKERFVYCFVMAVIFNLFVSAVGSTTTIGISIVASLILLIGLAKWLEFPWIVTHLELWLDRLGRTWDKRAATSEEGKREP
jgi:hypothetical protein